MILHEVRANHDLSYAMFNLYIGPETADVLEGEVFGAAGGVKAVAQKDPGVFMMSVAGLVDDLSRKEGGQVTKIYDDIVDEALVSTRPVRLRTIGNSLCSILKKAAFIDFVYYDLPATEVSFATASVDERAETIHMLMLNAEERLSYTFCGLEDAA